MIDIGCGCTPTYLGPSILDVCSASKYLVFMTLVENVVRNACSISEICDRITPTLVPDDEYDFVVIGAGSGGAPAAGILSEESGWKVLLLEAGIDEPPLTQVPVYPAYFVGNKYTDWLYKTEPEPQACLGNSEQRCTWLRGKLLGGCSVINAMIHLRGTPADFDGWEAEGNKGWSYKDVLPWFKHFENNLQVDKLVSRKYHGTGGPLTVSRFNYQPRMVWDVLRAGKEIGYPVRNDLDGRNYTGFGIVQATQDGVRMSTARAYLRPARHRKNLHIMLNSTATRIVVSGDSENKTATGVEFVYKNIKYTVKVKKEVILSAGAINSPQLLLLSGIGPKDALDAVKLKQVHDLPGVGQNIMNHVSITLRFDLTKTINTNILNQDTLKEYIKRKKGPLSSIGMVQVTARINTKYANKTGLDPDLQLLLAGYSQTCSQSASPDAPQDPDSPNAPRTLAISPTHLQPKSRGRITLRSSNPFEAPVMVANYLTAPGDIDVLVDGIRKAQKLASTKTLVSKYGIQLQNTTYGNCSQQYIYDSDDFWKCAIRYSTYPENHQTSSCKMGPSSDRNAVVDNELRVYGINGLRIADASVMPRVVAANTHATTVMIGVRAADFIRKTWLPNYISPV